MDQISGQYRFKGVTQIQTQTSMWVKIKISSNACSPPVDFDNFRGKLKWTMRIFKYAFFLNEKLKIWQILWNYTICFSHKTPKEYYRI